MLWALIHRSLAAAGMLARTRCACARGVRLNKQNCRCNLIHIDNSCTIEQCIIIYTHAHPTPKNACFSSLWSRLEGDWPAQRPNSSRRQRLRQRPSRLYKPWVVQCGPLARVGAFGDWWATCFARVRVWSAAVERRVCLRRCALLLTSTKPNAPNQNKQIQTNSAAAKLSTASIFTSAAAAATARRAFGASRPHLNLQQQQRRGLATKMAGVGGPSAIDQITFREMGLLSWLIVDLAINWAGWAVSAALQVCRLCVLFE